ncbi:zincin [Cadophora sp. DSE1049]|nr:zincin [Cadophora sp. DSE1049]
MSLAVQRLWKRDVIYVVRQCDSTQVTVRYMQMTSQHGPHIGPKFASLRTRHHETARQVYTHRNEFHSTAGSFGNTSKPSAKVAAPTVRECKPTKNKLKEESSKCIDKPAEAEEETPQPATPASIVTEILNQQSAMSREYYEMVRDEDSGRYFTPRDLKGAQIPEWDNPGTRKLGLRRRHEEFDALIKARAKYANLFGVKNYMDLRSRWKMLDTNSANAFLTEIKDAMAPYIHANNEDMLEAKMKEQGRDISFEKLRSHPNYNARTARDFQDSRPEYRLHTGDILYYSRRKIREDVWGTDSPFLESYFPTLSTSRRMVRILGHLFGVDFVEILPSQSKFRQIRDAYFGSSSAPPLAWGGRRNNGTDSLGNPITLPGTNVALAANFDPWDLEHPSLLPHSAVKDVAHELGHAIHRLVRGGTDRCPRDFIEIPSILIEKWASILHDGLEISNTGKALPPERAPLKMFDVIKLKEHPGNMIPAFQMLLWKSKFDLQAHSYSLEETATMDLALDCQMILRTSLENYPTSFYCYLLAEVYTVDIFTTFFGKDPLNAKQDRRFHKIVLEHWNSSASKHQERQFKKSPLNRLINYFIIRMSGHSENTILALEKFMGRRLSSRAFIEALAAPKKR